MRHLAHVVRGINVAKAVEQIDAHPELWDRYKLRTELYNTPHAQVSDIWVRYNHIDNLNAEDLAAFNNEHESVWYPAWQVLTELHQIVFDTLRFVCAERLGGVLITRIPPHGEVAPHVDRGWHASYYEKFAISLKAAPGQSFCFEDGEFESTTGDMWTFDNSFTHWVKNPTDQERMTLIICARRSF